jgi:hypothetical protein
MKVITISCCEECRNLDNFDHCFLGGGGNGTAIPRNCPLLDVPETEYETPQGIMTKEREQYLDELESFAEKLRGEK